LYAITTIATAPNVHYDNATAPTQWEPYGQKRATGDKDPNSLGMSFAAMAGLDV
ncbi:hypothetical protein V491_02027, partial [Pseudogymnoascus sp. VKM F-3775]